MTEEYLDKKYEDINKLEKVEFEIDKQAFKPQTLHCSKCKLKMKNAELDIALDSQIYIKLDGFECLRCNKKYFGLEEAKKLDKAFVFNRMLKGFFKMERNLSFDGDNYIFRIPKEFTHSVHKRKIDIIPLGANELCASVE